MNKRFRRVFKPLNSYWWYVEKQLLIMKLNIFSEYVKKLSRTKGAQNLNLIYAYDINAQEPVASSIWPMWNMLDYTGF